MKVIMVGGGTGGHIYPAIAIAEAIQDKILDSQILFIGSEEGLEVDLIPKERFSLVTIKSRGMLRKFSYKAISSPFIAIAGFFQSIGIIRSFKPDVIVATGGFASFPVILAGCFLRVPVVLHEGNVTPGLTTRICKWLASRIIISFEASRKYFMWRKVYVTGCPIRKEIVKTVKGIAIQNMGLRQDQKIILVLGGSQGAKSINKVIVDSLPDLSSLNVQLIHVCGQRDHSWVMGSIKGNYPFYHLVPYMYNIWDGLAAADMVISRAGATIISEILARGLPAILIPFPYSAEGHQDHNAKLLEEAGSAIVINDKELDKDRLVPELKKLLDDKPMLLSMQSASRALGKPDAAKEVVNIITSMLGMDINARKRKSKKNTAS